MKVTLEDVAAATLLLQDWVDEPERLRSEVTDGALALVLAFVEQVLLQTVAEEEEDDQGEQEENDDADG